MKKKQILSAILALLTVLTCMSSVAVSAQTVQDDFAADDDMPQYLVYGDANDDGNVTALDVLSIRKHIAGQSVKIIIAAGDVTNDKKITAADVLLIRKYIAGQNVTLGPEQPTEVISGDDKSYEQTQEFVQKIKCGWNLGNTLEAINIWGRSDLPENYTVKDLETGWGNPVTSKKMFVTVKNAGFNAVRIPVSWCRFISENNGVYTVEKRLLSRVREVINYAYYQGLYVIVNMHHDDKDWLDISVDDGEWANIKDKYAQVWTQIANYFNSYGERLIFEGSNEVVRFTGMSSSGTKLYDWRGEDADLERVNELNKVFVDTVRKTGGNNENRYLMIPTYGAQCDMYQFTSLEVPNDDARVIVDVHWYEANPNEENINKRFGSIYGFAKAMKTPVIVGECGLVNKTDAEQKTAWTKTYIRIASSYGFRCFIWDDGGSFSVMDRNNSRWYSEEFVKNIVENAVEYSVKK